MEISPAEIILTTWYLKAKGLISSDDKSNLIITVEGIDFLEQQRPNPAAIRRMLRVVSKDPIVPERAPEAVAAPPENAVTAPETPSTPPPAEPRKVTAIPSSLSRVIANLGSSVRPKV
jgi:hypothetical protein